MWRPDEESLTSDVLLDSYIDLAVSCFVTGSSNPPFDTIAPELQDAMIDAAAAALQSYLAADFHSFLYLRRGGLRELHVSKSQVDALSDLMRRELGVRQHAISSDWLTNLRTFWKELYEEPLLTSVDPAQSMARVQWIPVKDIEVIQKKKDVVLQAFREEHASTQTTYDALSIPGRASLAELAREKGGVTCFDFQFQAMLRDGRSIDVLLRMARDSKNTEWLLFGACLGVRSKHDVGEPVPLLL